MEKIIVVVFAAFLTGCFGSVPVKTRTEVVEVHKPILYCPAPNWIEIQRPNSLAIDSITPNMSDGEVVKRYKATVKQLQDYAERLELSLERYDSTNAAYEELRKEFLKEKELDGFKENSPIQ